MRVKVCSIGKGETSVPLPAGAHLYRVQFTPSATAYYGNAGGDEFRFGTNQNVINFSPAYPIGEGDYIKADVPAAGYVTLIYD